MKDSFLWYWLDYYVFGVIKAIVTEPRFWIGWGLGILFALGVQAL